jgi:hypothetical protein
LFEQKKDELLSCYRELPIDPVYNSWHGPPWVWPAARVTASFGLHAGDALRLTGVRGLTPLEACVRRVLDHAKPQDATVTSVPRAHVEAEFFFDRTPRDRSHIVEVGNVRVAPKDALDANTVLAALQQQHQHLVECYRAIPDDVVLQDAPHTTLPWPAGLVEIQFALTAGGGIRLAEVKSVVRFVSPDNVSTRPTHIDSIETCVRKAFKEAKLGTPRMPGQVSADVWFNRSSPTALD